MNKRMDALLQAQNLVKHYREVKAVDGISFAIQRGECYGLLGPNGAGKSTTMEILEGVIEADAGEIRFAGQPRTQEYNYEIGIQFQATSLQDFQSVYETLEMFAALYDRSMELDQLVELCHLHEFVGRDTRKLSGGQRQRLLLAVALVNDPQLVFLDEPTTGLDPQSRRNFWHLIEGIKEAGKTVLLTTHYMEEAYRLCDRIAIIDCGRIMVEGQPDQLLREHFPGSIIRLPDQGYDFVADLPAQIELRDGQYEMQTDDIPQALKQLEQLGFSLQECHIGAPTLEDLFLKLTGHALRN